MCTNQKQIASHMQLYPVVFGGHSRGRRCQLTTGLAQPVARRIAVWATCESMCSFTLERSHLRAPGVAGDFYTSIIVISTSKLCMLVIARRLKRAKQRYQLWGHHRLQNDCPPLIWRHQLDKCSVVCKSVLTRPSLIHSPSSWHTPCNHLWQSHTCNSLLCSQWCCLW